MEFPPEFQYNLGSPIEYANRQGLLGKTAGGLMGAGPTGDKAERTERVLGAVQRHFPDNPNAQAAIMGNIKGENHRFNYQEIEGEDVATKGYGLFQFTGPQRDAYFRYLNATGLQDNEDTQVGYFKSLIYSKNPEHEIGPVNQDRIREQINTGSVQDISDVITHRYENPRNLAEAQATRGGYSQGFSEQLGLPSPGKMSQTPRKPFGAMTKNQ
tara:strand:- start:56 stop:694 length:639 start_codon:yes stop_codon:yes gene_type:complete